MTTSTAVKFEIGDRVELVEDYGTFNTGDQGTVERVSPGSIDSIVKVKMDHKNGNGRDSINAFAYRLKKAADFKKGDRVAFNQDYDGHKIGDTGTVTIAEAPGTVLRGLYVTMDKDKDQVFAFVERWDKLPETKFKVGDRVQNAKGQFSYMKHKGKELEVVALRERASSYDYTVGVVGDTSRSHADYFEYELEAYVAPQPATFNVGDYAEVHGRLDGWEGAIVRIDKLPAGEFSFYKVNVVSGGQNDYTGSAHFSPSQLKAAEKPWEPKFKKGDWVEVTNNSQWAGLGQVKREASYSGDSLSVEMHADNGNYGAGKRGGFSESDVIPASEPKPFKIGDYVEVVGHNYSNGKKGWVVEPNSHWEGDDYIHITTVKGGKSEWRYPAENLKAAEEPVPTFEVGDYVQVSGYGNSAAYDHIKGYVTEPNPDEVGWVRIDATGVKEGKRQFPAENLVKIEAPKPELPTGAGDLIHVTKYKGETVDLLAMCDGTGDSDAWFAPIEVDGDYWLESQYIEAWSPAKVTLSL